MWRSQPQTSCDDLSLKLDVMTSASSFMWWSQLLNIFQLDSISGFPRNPPCRHWWLLPAAAIGLHSSVWVHSSAEQGRVVWTCAVVTSMRRQLPRICCRPVSALHCTTLHCTVHCIKGGEIIVCHTFPSSKSLFSNFNDQEYFTKWHITTLLYKTPSNICLKWH